MADMHKYQTKEILNKILNSGETAITTAVLPTTVTTHYQSGIGALGTAITSVNTTLYGMVISARRVDNTGDSIVGNRLHLKDGSNSGDVLIEIMFDKEVQTQYFTPSVAMEFPNGLYYKGPTGNDDNIDWGITAFYTV